MKTIVTFESDAFNTTEQKESFVNPDCFGDDLIEWLSGELNKRGYVGREPIAEDFGWAMFFDIGDEAYCVLVGYRPADENDPGLWILTLEQNVNFLKVIFKQNKTITPKCRQVLHEILLSNREVRNIRWHEERNFMKGKEELGVESPD